MRRSVSGQRLWTRRFRTHRCGRPDKYANVRYGNLTADTPGQPGCSNALTGGPATLDGGASNTAAYRYTLAAALVSQYQDSSNAADPATLNGGSPTNVAIQEAVWYITANNDFPPAGSNFTSLPVPNPGSAGKYQYWVNYALDNASSVNLNAWAVISGPANAAGALSASSDRGWQPFIPDFSGSGRRYPRTGLLRIAGPWVGRIIRCLVLPASRGDARVANR
jgi:hypothetical protein